MNKLFLFLSLLALSCSDVRQENEYNVHLIEQDGLFGVVDSNFIPVVYVTLWPNKEAFLAEDSTVIFLYEDGRSVFHTESHFIPHSTRDSAVLIKAAWLDYGYRAKTSITSKVLKSLGIGNR